MGVIAREATAVEAWAGAALATGIRAPQDGNRTDDALKDVSVSNDPVEIAPEEDRAVTDRTSVARAMQDRLEDAIRQEGTVSADAGPADSRSDADPAGSGPCAAAEPILCGHCGRTASNGISCQGFCVADSDY